MSDQEVDVLLKDLKVEKLVDRDSQEVADYFDVLDTIFKSYDNVSICESSIKRLHNQLLRHSRKDSWHKGNYKLVGNSIEAAIQTGTSKPSFKLPL